MTKQTLSERLTTIIALLVIGAAGFTDLHAADPAIAADPPVDPPDLPSALSPPIRPSFGGTIHRGGATSGPVQRGGATEAAGTDYRFDGLPARDLNISSLLPSQPANDVRTHARGWPDGSVAALSFEDLRFRSQYSTDSGASFSSQIDIAGDASAGQPGVMTWAVASTEGGKIHGFFWVLDPDGGFGIQYTRSSDKGRTWIDPYYIARGAELGRIQYWRGAAALDDGHVALVFVDEAGDPLVYSSTDGGISWRGPVRANYGVAAGTAAVSEPTVFYDSAGNLHVIYIQDRGSGPEVWDNRSSDGGTLFDQETNVSSFFSTAATPSNLAQINAGDGSILIALSADDAALSDTRLRVLRSTDQGATYSQTLNYDDTGSTSAFTPRIYADSTTVQLFTESGGNILHFRSTDHGASFSSAQVISSSSSVPLACRTDAGNWAVGMLNQANQSYGGLDSSGLFMYADVQVRTSTDGGASWGVAATVNDDPSAETYRFFSMACAGSDEVVVFMNDFRPPSDGMTVWTDRSEAASLSFGVDVDIDTDAGSRAPDNGRGNGSTTPSADGAGNSYVAFVARTDDLFTEVFVAASTDGGHTYGTPVEVGDTSKPTYALDTWPDLQSAYDATYGRRVYLTYVADNVTAGERELRFNYSSDGGASWQANDLLLGNVAGYGFGQSMNFASPATDAVALPGGKVFVAWSDLNSVYLARSTDGGANFTTADIDQDSRPWPRFPRLCTSDDGMRVVVVFLSLDSTESRWSVYAVTSADGGGIWDPRAQLKPDSSTSTGYYPNVACDSSGNAVAAWWDDRTGSPQIYSSRFDAVSGTWSTDQMVSDNSGAGYAAYYDGVRFLDTDTVAVTYASGDSVSTWIVRSTDGGVNWSAPLRLDTGPETPDPAAFSGFSRLESDGAGRAWVAWMDGSAGRALTVVARHSSDGGATWGPAMRVASTTSQGAQVDWSFITELMAVDGDTAFFGWSAEAEGTVLTSSMTTAWDLSDLDRDTIDEDDGDGSSDACLGGNTAACDDNCPGVPNADQADADSDGVGDVCDICPADADTDQRDGDADGLGDACDGPSVISVLPGDDAVDAAVYTHVTVRFSEAVDAATVGDTNGDGTADTFRLEKDGVLVPGVVGVTADGLQAEYDADSTLDLSAVYTVVLTSGITDLAGDPGTAFESQFRTEASSAPNTLELAAVGERSDGEQDNEELGTSVGPAGDVDGDGLMDWLVGAPGYDQDGTADRGRVLLYLGSTLASERTTPDVIFVGAAAGDRLGKSVAGGVDLNNDSVPDLLFGAPQHDGTTATGAGRAYVIHFNAADYPNLADPGLQDIVDIDSVADLVYVGIAMGDRAGHAVALSPDVNADGTGDLLIGAPEADRDGTIDRGEVYLVYGDPSHASPVDLSTVGGSGPSDIDGVTYLGSASGDALGWSVSAGEDFNGDGLPDVAFGAPFVDVDTVLDAPQLDAGTGYLDTEPNSRGITEVDDFGTPAGRDGLKVQGDQSNQNVGWDVELVSDHDGDGNGEFLIGAPGSTVGANARAGEAFLYSGGSLDVVGRGAKSVADIRNPSLGLGTAYQALNAGDELGTAVGDAGDTNGDGVSEVLLGAPGADAQNPTRLDAGATYLDMGTSGTPGRGITEVDDLGSKQPGAAYFGESAGDRSGSSLAGVGDTTGDGRDDFVAGAPQRDGNGLTDAGSSYLVTEEPDPVPAKAPECGPSGCDATDLGTGAELNVASGSLNDPVDLRAEGLRQASELPHPVPAGRMLVAAARFTPDRQEFNPPEPVAHLPAAIGVDSQLTNGDVFDIYRFDGYSWVDTGRDGTVEDNPSYPTRKSVGLSVDSARTYAAFSPDQDGDGTRDAVDGDRDGDGVANGADNCPDTSNPAQRDCDLDGTGDLCDPDFVDSDLDGYDDACDNCPFDANSDQLDGDGDGEGDVCDACPAEVINDEDGDGICCPADNCCLTSNPSQADADGNGIGDACDTNPVLRVSSDPSDNPDHSTVQQAVDAVIDPGTTIEVLPGSTGRYVEQVLLDRNLSMQIMAAAAGNPGDVIIDGGSGLAFDLRSASAGVAVKMQGLTLEGNIGLQSSVATDLRDLHLRNITGTGLKLDADAHRAVGLTMDATVSGGIQLAAAASLNCSRGSMRDLTGVGIELSGDLVFDSMVLAAGSGAGIVLQAGATLDLRYSTLADHAGIGVDNANGGTVTVLDSILWNNAGNDLVGVACADVSGSDVGSPDCSAVNGNISADPLFEPDYALGSGSPCLDAGADPSTYTGEPPFDGNGGPRLRDYDGDGMARKDIGAIETSNASLSPGDVTGVRWSDSETLLWDAEPSAVRYHIYRADIASLAFSNFGTCRDDLDPDLSDTQASITDVPIAGSGWSFTITAEDGGGSEGTLGFGKMAERSNYSPCP